MFKYLFKRDTIVATACVFLIMGLFALIPLNTHIFDPIKMALSDMSFNDLAFATVEKHKDNPIDSKIVVVDIGQADRNTIAATIEKINGYAPKAVAVDITFDGPRNDSADSRLRNAFNETKNLVLAEKIDWEHEQPVSPNFFAGSKPTGFINFVAEENGVIRYYLANADVKGKEMNSFAGEIVKHVDQQAFSSFAASGEKAKMINYRRGQDQYITLRYDSLLAGTQDGSLLRDKIVLVGYANSNPFDIEDKFFTPLNKRFAGKSTPDLNGIYIHANIVSMALSDDYVTEVPKWLMGLISVLIVWLHMAFFIKYYIEKHIWFHLVVKTVQLVSLVVCIYIGILLLSKASTQFSFTVMLGGIVLAVDVLYFYEGFAQWLKRKFGVKTIFGGHH